MTDSKEYWKEVTSRFFEERCSVEKKGACSEQKESHQSDNPICSHVFELHQLSSSSSQPLKKAWLLSPNMGLLWFLIIFHLFHLLTNDLILICFITMGTRTIFSALSTRKLSDGAPGGIRTRDIMLTKHTL